MKKLCILLTICTIVILTSCTTTQGCKGGGWYDKNRIEGKKR